MKITRDARQEAKRLFRACCPDGQVQEQSVRTVVSQLIEQKPRHYLAILSYFEKLLTLRIQQKTHVIESATPLPDQGAMIFQKLATEFGRPLATRLVVNPALLGGLRIQVGSDVYDGSIRSSLSRFQSQS